MSVMADIPTIGIGPKYSALLPYYIWRSTQRMLARAPARVLALRVGSAKACRRVGMECSSMRINRLIAPITFAAFAVLTLGQAAHADLLIAVDKSTQRMLAIPPIPPIRQLLNGS